MSDPQPPRNTDHDRNLLFGILALQMDFINRDALVTAMNAWVLKKSKPLGAILGEQGVLSASRFELLNALVQEHVKQHGDAEKSLAAVSSLGFVREDLMRISDSGLQATLAHVSTARAVEDPYATAPVCAGESTSSRSRFRILRFHDKGGLGKVSVARDMELQREVALKEIQEQFADRPDARSRFLLEGEITGRLEHPGIVPVYGLGQYADGRPYYAMRFIRGDSLQEAVDRFHDPQADRSNVGERAVELRKLLGRFLDVCNAIAYAHSRGILHRDLKPGNIMLGKFGETLVVDWGLAKTMDKKEASIESSLGPITPIVGSGSAPTMMGTAIGTPRYMSPEQATGRLDLLGPATDVYSLGATLYTLLTGRPPIDGESTEAVLRNVERGEFRPPRAVNHEIARPLEAICLKAMALKPTDRYATPKALANDIEHWLADEPISAYRDPLLSRLARAARQHKVATAAVAALLMAAITSLSIGTVLMRREQARTDQARQDAISAQQATEQSNLQLKSANLDLVDKTGKLQNKTAELRVSNQILKSERDRIQRLASLSFVAYGRVCELTARIANLDDSLIVTRGRSLQISDLATLQFRQQYDVLVAAGDPAIKPALDAFWNAMQKSSGDHDSAELRLLSLQLAHACGDAWRNATKDSPQLQERIRLHLYERASAVVDRIAKADELSTVSHSYAEFWELYWGELAILENDKVESAMVAFGKDLAAWKQNRDDAAPLELKESMRRKAISLHTACEIKASLP